MSKQKNYASCKTVVKSVQTRIIIVLIFFFFSDRPSNQSEQIKFERSLNFLNNLNKVAVTIKPLVKHAFIWVLTLHNVEEMTNCTMLRGENNFQDNPEKLSFSNNSSVSCYYTYCWWNALLNTIIKHLLFSQIIRE